MWRLPTPEFKVLVYGPDLPASGLHARAHFEPGVLVIQGQSRWFTVQVSQIGLKTGGYDGCQWLIAWESPHGPMTALLQGDDTVDAFIRVVPPEIAQSLARVRKAHARRKWKFKLAAALLGLVFLLPVVALALFWIFADSFSQWAAEHVTAEQEVRLGELAFEQLRPRLKLIEDGTAHDMVERVGVRLTAGGSQFRYQFHLARDAQVNAFALPGGQVVVNSGLLMATADAQELAGVLAHEISHVEQRHTLRNLIHGLGWRALLGVALGDFTGGVWGDMAEELVRLDYSRDLELEADRGGVELLRDTGLPADGLARFLARTQASSPPALFSTHPSSAERLAALKAFVEEMGAYPNQTLDIDWGRVKRDLARR
jgi:Zn-dependent protease with chaperone function